MREVFRFKAKVWEYGGKGTWHFVTLPPDIANVIKQTSTTKRGFGSVKVIAIINNDKWITSIFPDSNTKSYLLPIKKEVRISNNLSVGTQTAVSLSVIGE